jgi:F-type H+-transporting ATPase subunit a
MHEQSPVANFINQYLFDPLARALGFEIAAGNHFVPAHIVMILLISLGLIAFSLWLRRHLSVEEPGRIQHLVEVVLEALQGLMKEVIGSNARRYLPILGALAIYILCGNLLGLIPGFLSPTSNLNVTASCAVCVFVYYNYRLFGNIFAEELIIGSLNQYIFPFLTAVPVMFLALFASTIQAFIFVLLTMVYISGAVEEGEHKEESGAAHHESPMPPQEQAAAA